MRWLLLVLVLLAAGVGAVGYSRGWFTVSTTDRDKTIPLDISVDREKLKEDAEKARAKVKDVTSRDKAKAGESAKKEAAPSGPGGE